MNGGPSYSKLAPHLDIFLIPPKLVKDNVFDEAKVVFANSGINISSSGHRHLGSALGNSTFHRTIIMDPENNNKMADAYQPRKLYRIIKWGNKIKSFF